MNFVTPLLSFGNKRDGIAHNVLKKYKIRATLNVAHDLAQPIYDHKVVLGRKKGLLSDSKCTIEMFAAAVEDGVTLIKSGYSPLLVYCDSGIHRAPVVTAAILTKLPSPLPPIEALRHVYAYVEESKIDNNTRKYLVSLFHNWANCELDIEFLTKKRK